MSQPQLRNEPIEPDEEWGVEHALQPKEVVAYASNAAEPKRHNQDSRLRRRWPIDDGLPVHPRGRAVGEIQLIAHMRPRHVDPAPGEELG